MLNDYNTLIREHFDISDTKTRKYIVSLEDAQQTQLLAALSSALYDKIVAKVDKIDFGTIPQSRGDITKVDGFENTMECLTIMRQLVIEYKEKTDIVDTVLAAVENIKNFKGTFYKAFNMGIQFPTLIYCLITLAIEQSVSYLISVCIQYIKDPSSQRLESALDKVAYNNSRDNLLFEQLRSFNASCSTREMQELLDKAIKNGKVSEGFENDMNNADTGVNSIIINVGRNEAHGRPFIKYDGEKDREDPSIDCPAISGEEVKPMTLNDIDNEIESEPEEGCCPECGQNPCICAPVDDKMPQADQQVPINGSKEESDGTVNEVAIGVIIAGAATLGPIAIALGLKGIRFLLKVAIPGLRSLVYFMISIPVKFSETLSIQAQFIEANAYKLQYDTNSNLDDEKKKKVVEKQLKIAEKLKKWANKFAIDNKKAEKTAKEMSKEDENKQTIDDLPEGSVDDGGLF